VAPTAPVLAKGLALLNNEADEQNRLPDIHGDFSRLGGFSSYLKAVLRSKGKLVVFAQPELYGVVPLAELDKDFKRSVSSFSDYYLDRPRFLETPYSVEIARALQALQRLYPKAQLRPALILPTKTEAYILGALEKALGNNLYKYEYLYGKYRKDGSGQLIFTVTKGKKRTGKTEAQLPQKIRMPFGAL